MQNISISTDQDGMWLVADCLIYFHKKPPNPEKMLLLRQFRTIFPDWRSNIELDDGKIYRKALYLMVKTMVSCKFSLKPIH
jgi:hypothetical protein